MRLRRSLQNANEFRTRESTKIRSLKALLLCRHLHSGHFRTDITANAEEVGVSQGESLGSPGELHLPRQSQSQALPQAKFE